MNDDIRVRVDRLIAIERAERLRYDAALFSDIWKSDESRFKQFAALYGSTGSWDDGDGEGGLRGPQAIAEKLARLPAEYGLRIGLHLVGTPSILASGSGVTAEWPMICAVQSLDSNRIGFAGGRYEERYEYDGGRLGIASNVTTAAFMPEQGNSE
jgi:SnoaL-like domain